MKSWFILFCFVLAGCTSLAQDNTKTIGVLDEELIHGKKTISAILSDKNYMDLHPLTEFREIIKKHAKAEKVTMITDDEPGVKITVRAVVKTKSGDVLKNAVVYLYHTSDKGWYAADRPHVGGNEGDHRHARLFAYVKTNDMGEFEISTILPKGYPNSDLPAHIHIQMWKDGNNIPGVPGELLFDEDERLTPERKRRSLEEGFLIEKNTGTATNPLYQYNITIGG